MLYLPVIFQKEADLFTAFIAHPMVQDVILFLVIGNPFALMVYLSGLMNDTEVSEFREIMVKATLMSFAILAGCAFVGEFLLFRVLDVKLSALRIFGGLITLHLAFNYLMKGAEGIKFYRGNITELAQQITLPIMVGAGLVWVSIRMGESHGPFIAALLIGLALSFSTFGVLLYHRMFKTAKGRVETTLLKYFGMAMRFNAFLIGAVAIDMILGGINQFPWGGK